ncbi:Nephrin like protein [Argiope bruennichi]|uniref:Nephrin like protein n=1 Tax=Argiope bruennichi TaxID=94029 RepID=A0A8T0EHH5_ARGBR|nr:Nephrin like protein [Argiope bruennichi]
MTYLLLTTNTLVLIIIQGLFISSVAKDMRYRFIRMLIVRVVIAPGNISSPLTSFNKWTLVGPAAVVDPPSAPSISGYEEGKPIKAGDLQKFTCVSTGGNPPATLKWFKNDKELRGAEKSTTTGTTSDLVIRTEASDNGASYRCEAINSALKKPLTATITPSVLFPPSSVTIKMKPRKPKAGDTVTLTCETASSNPEATVLWWKDGESIPGHHEGVVDSNHGGKSTRNRVRFNVTSVDDLSTYTCQATNHVLRRTVHDTFVLRVLYKPEFLLTPAERFDVLEGESTVVNLTAKANPPQVTYSWTRNGLPLLDMADGSARPSGARYGHRAVYRGPLLELTDVTREDGGEYGCEAANTEGVTWTTVNINVIYPARITKLTRTVVVGSGETAEFECEAIANPFVSRMITWRRAGFDMSRTHETVEKGKSVLSVFNVSRQDAGEFECVAFNGIGTEAVQLAQLIVKFKPEVRLPHSFIDVAGEEGEAARLVCLAEGAPAMNFVWSYNGGVIGDNFSSSKYASQAAQLDDVTWESVLFVKHLQANDFGYYTCVARNELGHDHVKVKLRRRGPPDPPYNIRIVNTSSDSVVLSWTPGYSSGLPQQFRIRMSARNMLGESLYSKENTRAITQKYKPGQSPPTGASLDALSDSNAELPRLLLVVVSVVGSLLLALNIVLVICFIKRRKNRNSHSRGSPKALTQTTTPDSLMYTPSKYQQSINGEAICQVEDKDSYQEEILMKELFEAKKQVSEKCIPGYQTARPYDLTQSRKKDNCPDILKNRGMDHVSLQSVPLSTTLSSSDVITTLSDDSRYSRRVLLPDDPASLCHTRQTDSPPGSCVLGSVGSHLV